MNTARWEPSESSKTSIPYGVYTYHEPTYVCVHGQTGVDRQQTHICLGVKHAHLPSCLGVKHAPLAHGADGAHAARNTSNMPSILITVRVRSNRIHAWRSWPASSTVNLASCTHSESATHARTHTHTHTHTHRQNTTFKGDGYGHGPSEQHPQHGSS